METVLPKRKRIRSPIGAGMFYPEDRREILSFFDNIGLKPGFGGRAQAIIAPHGAWDLCGSLAANAFSSAMGRSGGVKRVVILGPIHDKLEKGLFLSNSHFFSTPLGNISVDKELTEELEMSGKFIEIDDIPHLREHSIEILLPFVKFCFPNASIVPILMGQPGATLINDLAAALKTVITPILDDTLLVVSCNLSSNNDKATARLLAEECLRLFSEKNAPALASAILDGSINACGGGLVLSLLESGLLDGKMPSSAADMASAESAENDTVFYNAVSFE